MTTKQKTIERLNERAANASLKERIQLATDLIPGRSVFTTSFGPEDQLITHVIAESSSPINFVTLDTGRLFSETYDLWSKTVKRYGIDIQPFYPKAELIEPLIREQGINGFYGSLAERKSCCNIRKVEPLARSLSGASSWVTGLRGGQSDARDGTPFSEIDEARDLIKINPLYDVSSQRLQKLIDTLDVPYNALHDLGFPSVGCQPCTRAVRFGEDERAGRWWWEQSDQECGLHADSKPLEVQPAENKAAA